MGISIPLVPFSFVMNQEIIENYLVGFDEINKLTLTSYRLAQDEDDAQQRAARIADDMLSSLILAYTAGIKAADMMLAFDLDVEIDAMNAAIYDVIDGKTFEQRVLDHVLADDVQALTALAESEYHRVYNAGIYDGGQQYKKNRGWGVKRLWITMKDDAVRKTHKYLEGMTVDIGEEFFTIDGDHAKHPGGFKKVENNARCRCITELIPEEA